MQIQRRWLGALALAAALGLAAPAGASSFARMGLDELVDENPTIVVGEVVGSRSYWNDAQTFILTDYRIAVSDVLKGAVASREITVTIPGGKVGDLTSVIVGGADLAAGKPSVLFLDRKDLLGSRGVLTVAAGADISFVTSAHLGDVLVAEAWVRVDYGRSGITDVTVTRESDGAVIAEFRGRSRSLPNR